MIDELEVHAAVVKLSSLDMLGCLPIILLASVAVVRDWTKWSGFILSSRNICYFFTLVCNGVIKSIVLMGTKLRRTSWHHHGRKDF